VLLEKFQQYKSSGCLLSLSQLGVPFAEGVITGNILMCLLPDLLKEYTHIISVHTETCGFIFSVFRIFFQQRWYHAVYMAVHFDLST
jgi:hypothetical protein